MDTYAFREHFWSHVDRSGGENACWLCDLSPSQRYATIRIPGGKTEGAHRVALILSGVSLDGGLHALHTCDVPRCCNPRHLYAGTSADNCRDRSERTPYTAHAPESYRRGKGRHHLARFTDDEVRAMREANTSGVSTNAIAARYEAAQATIWAIVRGKTYSHVDPA